MNPRKRPRPKQGPTKKPTQRPIKIDHSLKKVLSLIGVPPQSEFVPDPFQLEAVSLPEETDVLVSAPTGSGKTWIASQIISEYIKKDKRAWYATPLKALSNSIYDLFQREFGKELCGILTGDRKENPEAPIIVGTTEILRNQLYDAMYQGEDLRTDIVILDEAHYLSDPDRGVVWEEVMIYLPQRIRLVLLSATIPNAEELSSWLQEVRERPVKVVKSTKRPVPLKLLYYDPRGMLLSFNGRKGLNTTVSRIDIEKELRRYRPNFGEIISDLRALNLLPAIFFLKSREDCDRAIESCQETKGDDEIKELLRTELESFLRFHPHLHNHRQLETMMRCRVASHHAGQLPSWKLLVERMMNLGYLEAIFATSTVAAGVNFPARTVVLLQSDRFNGRTFVELTATEFHQMVGRAGRRGKDTIGFALVVPGPHQDISHIYEISKSSPEPVKSQLRINFSMVLNLLLSHTPTEILYLLERSFLTYTQGSTQRERGLVRITEDLMHLIKGGRCEGRTPLEIKEEYSGYKSLKAQLDAIRNEAKERLFLENLRDLFPKGRVLRDKAGALHVALYHKPVHRSLELVCLRAESVKGKRPKRQPIRALRLSEISEVYDWIIGDVTDMERVVRQVQEGTHKLIELNLSEQMDNVSKIKIRNREASLFQRLCYGCIKERLCHGKQREEMAGLLSTLEDLKDSFGLKKEEMWVSFERHLEFLKETGFVDENNRLTTDGFWASKLRLDYPLLIAELIRKGTITGLRPELVAASLAPFVWDRSHEVFIKIRGRFGIQEYEDLYERILEDLLELLDKLEANRFPIPQIPFWPGVAVYAWANGVAWKELMGMLRADEGDVAALIIRTIDHLRQVANLRDTHRELADAAERAIELLMREPVYMEQEGL